MTYIFVYLSIRIRSILDFMIGYYNILLSTYYSVSEIIKHGFYEQSVHVFCTEHPTVNVILLFVYYILMYTRGKYNIMLCLVCTSILKTFGSKFKYQSC